MAGLEAGLSELEVDGRRWWVDYRSDADRLDVVLVDDTLQLWRGHASTATLRPPGISAASYVGLLRKALRGQSPAGHFNYSITCSGQGAARQCRLGVGFKLGTPASGTVSSAEVPAPPADATGDIWLRGVDLVLKAAADSRALLFDFLSRQALAAAAALDQKQELRVVEEERESYRRAAEKAAAERAAAESTLLQSFVRVLNEKKRRLQELQAEVERLNAEAASARLRADAAVKVEAARAEEAKAASARTQHSVSDSSAQPRRAFAEQPSEAKAVSQRPLTPRPSTPSPRRPKDGSYPDFGTCRVERTPAAPARPRRAAAGAEDDDLFSTGGRSGSRDSTHTHGSKKRKPSPCAGGDRSRRRGGPPGAVTAQDLLWSDSGSEL
eukprot:TRINITY_DN43231_c0_g1_i1.p1 TRINITY_DN43231_c0_g1~~TRINITY_DN43231_c0_g1_i1.p1  ORF type:complete len:398 (+),score=126.04 TRINITY_DN43231_c0_g1_i1:48-1196(+)